MKERIRIGRGRGTDRREVRTARIKESKGIEGKGEGRMEKLKGAMREGK